MSLSYYPPTTVSAQQLDKFKSFALDAAEQGGAATLPFFRHEHALENKLSDGNFDPVTAADKACESEIRRLIEARFPEHGIFGEEEGSKTGTEFTWVIDPIDGTRAFITGMLHWGVLLALLMAKSRCLA